ncbi:hypothetical protein WN51_01369 [Melipona quadrifasciata]|uniref:Uncharacterized protein n=1 Tax=Melipona quadrifasciata TaxID=166423 RepID=A0A0N0U4T4_9HYME|nr:hypothetical protein WN51_01369 [Melipona quadrifasciata]
MCECEKLETDTGNYDENKGSALEYKRRRGRSAGKKCDIGFTRICDDSKTRSLVNPNTNFEKKQGGGGEKNWKRTAARKDPLDEGEKDSYGSSREVILGGGSQTVDPLTSKPVHRCTCGFRAD